MRFLPIFFLSAGLFAGDVEDLQKELDAASERVSEIMEKGSDSQTDLPYFIGKCEAYKSAINILKSKND